VKPCLEKPFTKIGLVDWFKVKALSSSLQTEKKKFKKASLIPLDGRYWQSKLSKTTRLNP
jgi:hypothetical protein